MISADCDEKQMKKEIRKMEVESFACFYERTMDEANRKENEVALDETFIKKKKRQKKC